MFNIVERFMNNLTIEQVNNFAIKNSINLSSDELDYTYKFIRKNWQPIASNPGVLNLNRYKHKFSEENFNKIEKLFNVYSKKYKGYL